MARVLLADSQPLFNEALEALFSSQDAVRTHIQNILEKLGMRSKPSSRPPPTPCSAPWSWS